MQVFSPSIKGVAFFGKVGVTLIDARDTPE